MAKAPTGSDLLAEFGELYRNAQGSEVWRLRDWEGKVIAENVGSDHDAMAILLEHHEAAEREARQLQDDLDLLRAAKAHAGDMIQHKYGDRLPSISQEVRAHLYRAHVESFLLLKVDGDFGRVREIVELD